MDVASGSFIRQANLSESEEKAGFNEKSEELASPQAS
jgi:hypothetical protein